MMRRLDAIVLAAGVLVTTACNNPDVPEVEPTLGTGGTDDGGVDETGGQPTPACAPEVEPSDPSLFQCVGAAQGSFARLECKKLACDSAASVDLAGSCDFDDQADMAEDWTVSTKDVDIMFPPSGGADESSGGEPEECDTPTGECNAQACCESDATVPQLEQGCIADCGRAACNKALKELEDKLADGPPAGCPVVAMCVDNWTATLTTWIDFLTANFDVCVEMATNDNPDDVMQFPNPNVEAEAGSGVCGRLHIQCELDEPFDTEESCSDSLNEAQAQSGMMLQCQLNGDAELTGPQGNAFSTLAGTVILRRQTQCTTADCWFSIESLELNAPNFSQSGYVGRNIHASLAYPGFGLFDLTSSDGMIAPLMFGLDVTLWGDTPSTTGHDYAFAIGNTDSAVFEVRSNAFQIVDAYFAWANHSLVITTDLASCTCINCT